MKLLARVPPGYGGQSHSEDENSTFEEELKECWCAEEAETVEPNVHNKNSYQSPNYMKLAFAQSGRA